MESKRFILSLVEFANRPREEASVPCPLCKEPTLRGPKDAGWGAPAMQTQGSPGGGRGAPQSEGDTGKGRTAL